MSLHRTRSVVVQSLKNGVCSRQAALERFHRCILGGERRPIDPNVQPRRKRRRLLAADGGVGTRRCPTGSSSHGFELALEGVDPELHRTHNCFCVGSAGCDEPQSAGSPEDRPVRARRHQAQRRTCAYHCPGHTHSQSLRPGMLCRLGAPHRIWHASVWPVELVSHAAPQIRGLPTDRQVLHAVEVLVVGGCTSTRQLCPARLDAVPSLQQHRGV